MEGQNVAIEYRWAEGQFDRLPELAADLVRRRVTVIAALGGPSQALAAKAAITTIPVVFLVGEDPVRLGLVASLARPGGNLTGINSFSGEVAAKRLNLLRELVPIATRVAVLVNPVNASDSAMTLRDVQVAAQSMKLQIQVLNASTSGEIDTAFATFVGERPDALLVGGVSSTVGASIWSLWHPRRIRVTRQSRRRGVNELWDGYCGRLSTGRGLHRPHSQGRETCGPAGSAVDQS